MRNLKLKGEFLTGDLLPTEGPMFFGRRPRLIFRMSDSYELATSRCKRRPKYYTTFTKKRWISPKNVIFSRQL